MKRTIDKTVNLDMVGHNGNAFAIMGVFQRQARKEGWTEEEINLVLDEAKAVTMTICSRPSSPTVSPRI